MQMQHFSWDMFQFYGLNLSRRDLYVEVHNEHRILSSRDTMKDPERPMPDSK